MMLEDIPSYRLANQQISQRSSKTPSEVVSSLGAMQAQDFKGALWAVGLRLPNSKQTDIRQAIDQRRIIRTWPMRGTLHFVCPSDVRWMLGLYREQSIPNYQKRNGLNEKILAQGQKIIVKTFGSKKRITSKEIYSAMQRSGIPELKMREVQAHILRRSARDGIICYAAHEGKQTTFALLDDWVAEKSKFSREDAVAELASRYFTSHGPATIKDYIWWSGMRVSDARSGIAASTNITEEEIGGKTYYMAKKLPKIGNKKDVVYLLPAFDEYLVSYSDRSAMLGNPDTQKALRGGIHFFVTPNGIFMPTVVADGAVVGTWKSVPVKDKIEVQLILFTKLTSVQHESIETAAARYGKFMDSQAVLKIKQLLG